MNWKKLKTFDQVERSDEKLVNKNVCKSEVGVAIGIHLDVRLV